MSMALADLIADHSAQLGPAATDFVTDDLERHLHAGAGLLKEKRARIETGELTLVAGERWYAAPENSYDVLSLDWGREFLGVMPYQHDFLGVIPCIRQSGRRIHLLPAPTTKQIALLGAVAAFQYLAEHHLDADAEHTTVAVADRDLLLHAALIATMRELSSRNVADPIQLHRGIGAIPSNSTPAAWYAALLDEWRQRR